MSGAHAYQPSNLAPWAEVVPGVGFTTVASLLCRVDDGWQYEVVEGVLVRVAGSGLRATTIARRIGARLGDFVDDHDLGFVSTADGVYKFPGAETGLIPDVGFLRAARRQRIADLDKPIPFPPDLAIEVASPSRDDEDLAAKALRYLQAGTALVWIIWPERRQVDVWHARDTQPSVTLDADDLLDGEDIVPGFSCPIAPLLRI